MDLTDIKLIKLLERKPRASCSELAAFLDISAPSVQRRIADLEDSKRIVGYTAYLSPRITSASIVIVHGQAKRPLTPQMLGALANHGSVRRIAQGTMNHYYLIIVKKNANDLDGVVTIFQDICEVDDPKVLFVGGHFTIDKALEANRSPMEDPSKPPKLKKVDYQIILSLHENARKPITAISNELGISARTVRRRLERMERESIIEYDVLSLPRSAQDLILIFNISLKSRAQRDTFLEKLRSKNDILLDEVVVSDNSPRTFFVDGTAQTTAQLNDLLKQLSGMPEVDSVMADVVTDIIFLETNVDRMLRQRAAES